MVPNGVDMTVIAAAPPSTPTFDLIYVGRLLSHKRVADLIEAMDHLDRDGVPLTCAIVGVGPERDALEALAAQHQVADRVQFFGALEQHADVYGLIKSSVGVRAAVGARRVRDRRRRGARVRGAGDHDRSSRQPGSAPRSSTA